MDKKELYQSVTEAILVEAGVGHVVYLDRHIRAYAAREPRGDKRWFIVLPRPTTPSRVMTVAHEAAHVYLRHGSSVPSHRKEYEAENYSYAALKRYGIEFDEKKAVSVGQAYVASKIRMGRGSLRRVCRESYAWAEKHLRDSAGGKEVVDRVATGNIKLVNMKRPDPTKAPRPQTRTLEITFYEPGKNWHGRKSGLSDVKSYTKRYAPSWIPELRGMETRKERPHARRKISRPQSKSFTETLRTAIDESGQSVYAIAKVTGIPQPVLARFHNGTRDNLRLDVAETLARYLGYSLQATKR